MTTPQPGFEPLAGWARCSWCGSDRVYQEDGREEYCGDCEASWVLGCPGDWAADDPTLAAAQRLERERCAAIMAELDPDHWPPGFVAFTDLDPAWSRTVVTRGMPGFAGRVRMTPIVEPPDFWLARQGAA